MRYGNVMFKSKLSHPSIHYVRLYFNFSWIRGSEVSIPHIAGAALMAQKWIPSAAVWRLPILEEINEICVLKLYVCMT